LLLRAVRTQCYAGEGELVFGLTKHLKGQLSWDDVEAWVCQQRLEKFLRERKQNPEIPARSLSLAQIPTEVSHR
jgi:hypothetical protein